MNKFARLLALALVCALTLGFAAAAQADTCYETLKYTFSIEDNGDFAWLGQGTLVPGEESETDSGDSVFFYISFEGSYASVIGRNADGQPESCLWMEADPAELLLASVQVAASYEQLCEYLDDCTELVLVLDSGEEDARIYVASPEDAEAYLKLMQAALEQDASGSAVADEPVSISE